MKDLLNRNRKAIVGLLTPAVVFVGAKAGLSLSDEEAGGVASFVTAAVVYYVPNAKKES
jgi:TRAP-type C4-dicarboxylate transport system permease large subunit